MDRERQNEVAAERDVPIMVPVLVNSFCQLDTM